MNTFVILDTFPAFLAYWQEHRGLPLNQKIQRWADQYLAPWSELLALQIEDYRTQNLNWRQIAEDRIFPHINERLPAMNLARENLLAVSEVLYSIALKTLGFSTPVIFVIHVGIGCGAGWVTRYQESPAILFGLENIAECGWQEVSAIKGLVAHEIGHLAHHAWREQQQQPIGSGPWWQLYEEGFAQHAESLLNASPAYHQTLDDPDWLSWCQANRSWLAAEFLHRVDAGEPVTPFFGSWFDLYGKKETGYFLGCEAIQQIAGKRKLKEIAMLDDPETNLRPILEKWANKR